MKVLAVGAHPDDIELGCGATLLRHRANGDRICLLVMTTGEQGPQDAHSRVSEQEDAAAMLGADLIWGTFPDGSVPVGRAAIDVIQQAAMEADAEIVYTHAPDDTHQDHRSTALATLAACRRQRRILQYEAPTSRAFAPSVFVDATGYVGGKLELLRAHESQVLKNGLVDLEAIEASIRYRGFQARVHVAEAFATERFLWELPVAGEEGSVAAISSARLPLDLQPVA